MQGSESARPAAIDAAEFRAAMSRLPTAVTVVTATGPEGPAGLTANAVVSLSLDPPLMLACLDRGSRTLRAVESAGRFGISVLGAGDEDIAAAFATKAPQPEKWEGIAWTERRGVPALDDAVVWVACELENVLAGGDHVIVTGNVLEVESSPGAPLVFHAGAYRPLESGA
jgi:3-hydroxy-9,10-secoandrosta-1,3,5(10)-triene-9,17-dione monooxygenase reductase component